MSSFSMSNFKEVSTLEIQMRLEKCPSAFDSQIITANIEGGLQDDTLNN